MARRKRTAPRPPLRQRLDPRVHHRTLERTQSHALPNPLPTRHPRSRQHREHTPVPLHASQRRARIHRPQRHRPKTHERTIRERQPQRDTRMADRTNRPHGRNPRKIRQNRPERTNRMAHATPDHRRRGRRTHTGVQHPMAGHHLGRMAHGIRRRLHRRLERRIRSRHKRHAQRRHRHHHRHTPPLEDQTTRRQGAEERDTHPPPPTAGTEKHERTTAGEPPAPPHPHVRHARNPAGLRPPQAGTEDGEGRNVRRPPACNRRRDTARRTFRPSPSGEQAND